MSKVGMRRETLDARMMGARREAIDESHASCLMPPRVSGLTSRAPWPKITVSASHPQKLDEVCLLIADCPHSTAQDEGEGFPLVRTPNIGNGRLIFEKMHRVSRAVYEARNKRAKPQAGDLIYAREAPAGNVALITKGQEVCLGQRTVLLRPNPTMADSAFLTYYLLAPEQRHRLLGTATGATVTHVNLPAIRNLEVALPPLPVQRRIADILSAYDDLIENNRRRIAILEETARLAYRKWFDGAEQGRTATLGEVAEVLYGKDHKKIPDGTIPIFGSGGVMRYGATAIFDKPSVLIPRKGTIGNVMYVDEPFWTVDTMFYTRFKLPNMEKILYYQLCDYNLASMSTGAAVPSMTTAILNSLEIEVPPDDLRIKFDMAVEPMFAQKRLLKKQNAALATARDMLLPRLMKGEGM